MPVELRAAASQPEVWTVFAARLSGWRPLGRETSTIWIDWSESWLYIGTAELLTSKQTSLVVKYVFNTDYFH